MYRKNGLYGKLFLFLLIAIIFLGVGYAAISNINLRISGSAVAKVDKFEVKFNKVEETESSNNEIQITANIIDDTHSEFNVSGMQGYGDTAIVRYAILNNSDIADAKFTITSSVSDTEFFSIENVITDSNENNIVTLGAGETAYLTVKAKVIKVSTNGSKNATVNVKIKALRDTD